jgi:hypothetical protein
MYRAGSIGAQLAVPPVAVPCDPQVNLASDKMNSRNQQHPGNQLPPRHAQTDARPCVHARINSSLRINSLHQPHSFLAIHLGETQPYAGIVQVQKLNTPAAVHFLHAVRARAAQSATAIVKYGKNGHGQPRFRLLCSLDPAQASTAESTQFNAAQRVRLLAVSYCFIS